MHATLGQVMARDRRRLAQALGLSEREARLEAQVLLSRALQSPRAFVLAHEGDALPPEREARYRALMQRRLQGEPMAYILGEREFYGLVFKTTPAALIPRPETELLVELALARIPADSPRTVLDLGTGSGAVAVAIARHRPLARITAVDRCPQALALARENAARLGAANVELLESDWYGALGVRKFDIIVANPPYVAEADRHLEQGDLRFEPRRALAAGKDGLDAIRAVVDGAPAHLSPGGRLLFEHGHDQADACRDLLRSGGFVEIASHPDLAGIPRVTGGRAG